MIGNQNIGGFLMITFSVNKEQEKMFSKGMIKLVSDMEQGKTYTAEAISTIVDKILDDGIEVKDLTAYSREIERISQLKREEKAEVPIITQDELLKGFKGVVLSLYEDELSDISLIESIVQEFIDIREKIYFAEGKDIYRLLYLGLQGDKVADEKLNSLRKLHTELSIILNDVLSTPGVVQRLIDILA